MMIRSFFHNRPSNLYGVYIVAQNLYIVKINGAIHK